VRVFFDTSSLAKRYVVEEGSAALEKFILKNVSRIVVSVLAFPEFASAISRKLEGGEISPEDVSIAIEEFETDWNYVFEKSFVSEEIAFSAAELCLEHHLRGADAIHLASALSSGAEVFICSDKVLLQVALKCGLEVFNPEEF
jgi:hypothetical protein